MKNILLLSVLVVLSGCAAKTTAPVKDQSGAYYIHTDSYASPTNATAEGIKYATQYCENSNKEVVILSNGGGHVTAKTRFRCE